MPAHHSEIQPSYDPSQDPELHPENVGKNPGEHSSTPVVAPPQPGQSFVAQFQAGRQPDAFAKNTVLNLIDVFARPPPIYVPEYAKIVFDTATWLGAPKPPTLDGVIVIPALDPELNGDHQSSTSGLPSPAVATDEQINQINKYRNRVFDLANEVVDFVAVAKNAGYVPPVNPFALAQSFNQGRVGFTPIILRGDTAQQIYEGVQTYILLIEAWRQGKLNINASEDQNVQLSHVSISLEGYGGSGDVALDLSKLLPNSDEIKAQKSLDALAALDFKKRVPDVIFTAQYSPDNVPRGVLVGWKRMPDASGYSVLRRNVFTGAMSSIVRTNEQLKSEVTNLKSYVDAFVSSFYDKVHVSSLLYCLDTNAPSDAYLLYQVQGYQLRNDDVGTIFSVEVSPVFFTNSQKDVIRNQLIQLEPSLVRQLQKQGVATRTGQNLNLTPGPDVISPYPVLSQFLFGDAKYDWLLAALNVRGSIQRKDDRSTTRSYSYLTAQLSFLFAQADAGKLVVPKNKDFTQALNNVNSSVVKFGVSQTLQEVLNETGCLYSFDGKDTDSGSSVFSAVNVGVPQTRSNVVEIVERAIDPETATLDLRQLAGNMTQLIDGQFVSTEQALTQPQAPQSIRKQTNPAEIFVPDGTDATTDVRADDEVQFLGSLGDMSQVVDLTTADGISVFMRAIRVMSDIGPGRGAPVVASAKPVVPDPVVQPPPPNITISHENAVSSVGKTVDNGDGTSTQESGGLVSEPITRKN